MTKNTLHYIFDPLCGWCYAAAPLIKAARQVSSLQIALHAGGLWTGNNVKKITPELRDYVMANDKRISQLTGQPFGDEYFDGLLQQDDAVLDSEPPIVAILAVEAINHRGLDMLDAIQNAHFVQGRQVSTFAVLSELANDLEIDPIAFDRAYQEQLSHAYVAHLHATHNLMSLNEVHGFPSMLIESDEQWLLLNHQVYYGNAEQFAAQLNVH